MQVKCHLKRQEYNNTIYIILQVPFNFFSKIVNYDNVLCQHNYVNCRNLLTIWGVFENKQQDIDFVFFVLFNKHNSRRQFAQLL